MASGGGEGGGMGNGGGEGAAAKSPPHHPITERTMEGIMSERAQQALAAASAILGDELSPLLTRRVLLLRDGLESVEINLRAEQAAVLHLRKATPN